MKRLLLGLLLTLGLCPMYAQARTTLTVYAAVEEAYLEPCRKAFEFKHSEVRVKWVRGSSEEITARILAEKAAPKADVVMGLDMEGILALDQAGMFESYIPGGAEDIPGFMRDKRQYPTWTGLVACPAAICANTQELRRLNLPMPLSWNDLLEPMYKGHIIMADPGISQPAYAVVSAWLQAWGGERGWAFMAALDKNTARYVDSGTQAAEMAARGEAAIAVTEAATARALRNQGAPLEVRILEHPVPVVLRASAIVRESRSVKAARKFLDFSISPEMAAIMGDRPCVTAQPSVTRREARNVPEAMGNYDFFLAARKRQEIRNAWKERFGSRDPS